MNDFLYIHIPLADDEFVAEFERIFGTKPTPCPIQCIPKENVEVCPMGPPSNEIGYLELKL